MGQNLFTISARMSVPPVEPPRMMIIARPTASRRPPMIGTRIPSPTNRGWPSTDHRNFMLSSPRMRKSSVPSGHSMADN